jgi:hypothetical protein
MQNLLQILYHTHTVAITTVHSRLSASNCGTHWCQQQNIYPTPWQSLVSGADNLPHIMMVTSVWCRTFTKKCVSFSCHLSSWSTGIFMAQNGLPQIIAPISNTVLTGNKIWTYNDLTHNFKSCAYGKQGLDLIWLTLQWLFKKEVADMWVIGHDKNYFKTTLKRRHVQIF